MQKKSVMMVALPALLGLALCLLNIAGADLFCLTTGCAIYAGYALFGLSFYAYGALGFGVIALLAFAAGKVARAVTLLGVTLLAALMIDGLFLGWQLLYWPCSSCLVVALLVGAAAVGFWRAWPHWQPRLLKGALLLWLTLLIPVTVAVGKDVLLVPWVIHGPASATVQIFFSPSCPACDTEVEKLLRSPASARTAFIPIAKNQRDMRLLAALLREGIEGPADLARLFRGELADDAAPSLLLRWRLARNKMVLAGLGSQTIPLIFSQTVLEVSKEPDLLLTFPGFEAFAEPAECGVFDPQEQSCK